MPIFTNAEPIRNRNANIHKIIELGNNIGNSK
jgi:hypothetical protein